MRRTINETVLENVVVQAINTLLGDKSTYQTQLQQNIAKVIRSAQQNTADGIDERLQELQKELLKKANNKEAYDEIADEIFKLRDAYMDEHLKDYLGVEKVIWVKEASTRGDQRPHR